MNALKSVARTQRVKGFPADTKLKRYWLNVGPQSTTLDQRENKHRFNVLCLLG